MRIPAPVSLTLAGLALAACSDAPLVAPDTPLGAPSAARPAAVGPLELSGEVGPGSSYRIVVPPAWNGDLVVYAHGYVEVGATDVINPLEEQLLAALAATGHAVAYSTFSENGLAVKDGAQRTKQLRGIFVSRAGRPNRTYVIGGSMGGLIGVDLVERFPGQYDGLLALCGMVGGTQAQTDYASHVRVLFDYFYPGVLPGSLFDNPPLSPAQITALVGAAVTLDPAPAALLAQVMGVTLGTPVPATSPAELVESLVTALAFNVRGFADVLERTHGHSPFDNADLWYVGSGDDAALNDPASGVARYTSTPDARNYLERHYEPTGALEVPVITLHNAFDPVVPIFHESRLAGAASAAGQAGNLVQRTAAAPYGHCNFNPLEVVGVFGDLVAWVSLGLPPAP